MEFALHYAGPLKGNADAKTKHELRRHFHRQLKMLWDVAPLRQVQRFLDPNQREGETCVLVKRDDYVFAPLVTALLNARAELRMDLFRPGPPGAIFAQGGDIDNRLKTVFDALKVPDPNAVPAPPPQPDEQPHFFCLLEDDKLISSVSVTTHQLLEVPKNDVDVTLTIHVTIRVSGLSWDNSVFVG